MTAEHLRAERRGRAGWLTLSRPDRLNALTLPMVRAMTAALRGWEADPAVGLVVTEGEGGRAFCAGGDVRAVCRLREAGLAPETRAFFLEEYRLNLAIHRFPKPYLALMDGVTMGGGVGISVHGFHRVATEATRIAMPETGIGFFPDVGASYLLPRLPAAFGPFLGLTGAAVGPGDALALGLATHFVPRDRLPRLREALAHAGTRAEVGQALEGLSGPAGPAPLWDRRAEIERAFGQRRLDEVLEELALMAREGSDWARRTREDLLRKSPTGLKVTWEALRRGRSLDLASCLAMEYRLVCRFLAARDFCEGVRAVLEDRDGRPRWDPPDLERVSDEAAAAFFEPLPPGEEWSPGP
ncbi:enoyl-CoA hydratase/isomerase family protein [Deferrisoma camini]|uniref:enoyl-CoA hydratase/isomerase family protein n=1 Tax=Deferrisoma camini TaxID=1035120 RepID=UPI00046CF2FC|nr:enoyl-CoA hydratase/isomerase family protein [Deferrisoma camini]